jgi:hypothetical protein
MEDINVLYTLELPHSSGYLRGLVLGFMMNPNWSPDYRMFVLLYSEGEDPLELVGQKGECDFRVAQSPLSDFFAFFNADPPRRRGRIHRCDDLICDQDSSVVTAARIALNCVETHVASNRSWRPRSLKKTMEDLLTRSKTRAAAAEESKDTSSSAKVVTSSSSHKSKDATTVLKVSVK